MSISVNNILDAGLLVHGKLPDLYWNIEELTGAELKILRYVFNNCLRLYKDLKYFPRGKDGSPRFWRGKESMAEDCGVSYVTFRKSIRHMSELGLVTSMDGEESEDELYCIGLSSKYLENHVNTMTVKNFRLHSLIDLIVILYDSITVDIIDLDKLEKLPSITNVIELNVPSDIGVNTESPEKVSQENSNKQQKIKRTAIVMERKPILTVPEVIRNQTYTQKLNMLKGVRTPHEKKIYEMAEYYEYKCRKALNSTGFRSLGKDPRNSKNWLYFEKVLQLCIDKGWDYKLYIDSQFDRVHYWNRKQLYPYLNQMLSERAQAYFEKYIKDYQDSNSITGAVKAKAEKVKSTKQIIIDNVIKDCEDISDYIEKAQKRRANKGLTPEQLKILYISDHWTGLSGHYLSVIPWFMSYLNSFPEEPFVVSLKEEIQRIQKSKNLSEITKDIVDRVENQMSIPSTMCM